MEHKNTSSGGRGSYTISHPPSIIKASRSSPLTWSSLTQPNSLSVGGFISECHFLSLSLSFRTCHPASPVQLLKNTIDASTNCLFVFPHAMLIPPPDSAMTLAPLAPCSHSVCKIERMLSLRDQLFIANPNCVWGDFVPEGPNFYCPVEKEACVVSKRSANWSVLFVWMGKWVVVVGVVGF